MKLRCFLLCTTRGSHQLIFSRHYLDSIPHKPRTQDWLWWQVYPVSTLAYKTHSFTSSVRSLDLPSSQNCALFHCVIALTVLDPLPVISSVIVLFLPRTLPVYQPAFGFPLCYCSLLTVPSIKLCRWIQWLLTHHNRRLRLLRIQQLWYSYPRSSQPKLIS